MSLEVRNITYSFGKTPLLNNLSLLLEKGKIYALVGGNGSGKTTLFNIINGFYKPQKGDIFYNKKNLTRFSPNKINKVGIGRTFQDLRLIAKLTVKENVLLSMQGNPISNWYKAILPRSFYKKEISELQLRADSIIEEYFLHDVKNSFAGEISYGQQKLLNLACCVANSAELLLLDEPLAGINHEYKTSLCYLLQKLKGENKTILMIEHHMETIEGFIDSIFFLSQGNVQIYNSYKQLKDDPIVLDAYL